MPDTDCDKECQPPLQNLKQVKGAKMKRSLPLPPSHWPACE